MRTPTSASPTQVIPAMSAPARVRPVPNRVGSVVLRSAPASTAATTEVAAATSTHSAGVSRAAGRMAVRSMPRSLPPDDVGPSTLWAGIVGSAAAAQPQRDGRTGRRPG